MTEWFARPILKVKDVDVAIRFYVDTLGFTSPWRYDEEGRARVAQVERQGCVLIVANNLSAEGIGKAVIFVSLNVEPATPEGATAALDALRDELEGRGVRVREDAWGYRLLVVEDPDGNQLLFNYPREVTAGA